MAIVNLNKRIAHTNDDGSVRVSDDGTHSGLSQSSPTLPVIRSSSSGVYSYWVYLRFTNVTIPKGQTFYQSRISLNVYRRNSFRTEGKTFRIYGVATDNFSRPTTSGDIATAPLTTEYYDFTVRGKYTSY